MSKVKEVFEALDIGKNKISVMIPQLVAKYDIKINELIAEMEEDEKLITNSMRKEGNMDTGSLMAFRRLRDRGNSLANDLKILKKRIEPKF